MNLWQLPRCAFGRHHRDRRRAWYDSAVIRSYCTGCGKPMLKDQHGWHLAAPADAVAQPEHEPG
jgi:hypothetical protein